MSGGPPEVPERAPGSRGRWRGLSVGRIRPMPPARASVALDAAAFPPDQEAESRSREEAAPARPAEHSPDRIGEAPVARRPVRSPGGASRRAREVRLHRRLRIGARRPWTACEARRPRGGPTRPDRHGSIGLQLHGRAPYESRRRWPLHSGCTPAAPPLPAHPRHRTGQRAATISLFRLSQDFSSPVNHRLTRHESPDTRTMASHFPARFQPASGCPVPYQM